MWVNPPKSGENNEETVSLYESEVNAIKSDLKDKAKLIQTKINKMPGFKCNDIEGAMYAFPSITFPQKIIEAAKAKNLLPDVYYCLELVEKTGIIIVPGSAFGQKEGTYHVRVTNLICPKEEMEKTLDRMSVFNKQFFNK